jgi:acyl carrier protein
MLQEIIDVLSPYTDYPAEQINEETNLIDDLELNSFDILTIVSEVEEEYSIHIPDEVIPELTTVGAIERYIESNR